ncbi:hypothetical protein ACMFMG_000049 [Clarireedia jacksonii]
MSASAAATIAVPVKIRLSDLAAGFTVGFGIWTFTAALRQTKICQQPKKSIYIFMIWLDLFVIVFMGVLTWVMINGYMDGGSVIYNVLISIIWILELQLYYQILISRCGLVIDDQELVTRAKWWIAVFIGFINISVLAFWLPTQLNPISARICVLINSYWDRVSKGILLTLDIILNLYFLRMVHQRIVKYHGLVKYMPLVRFNSWLMIISIAMDAMLISVETLAIAEGTRWWQQFHPMAYIVKLHIELSLGTLISKIAKGSREERENYLTIDWYKRGGDTESAGAMEKVATRPKNWRTKSHESDIDRGMEITIGMR